ncbi:MAG: isopentenyl phosphate kinase [Candidatus Bathyarchaeota archaeon]|nr:isopentenyl phosphate kinase [Candidatus Bathyarchaeota archaeon]
MMVVKLGGSVLTDKSRPLSFNEDVSGRLADEIVSTGEKEIILIHGGGSYGHYTALAYGLDKIGKPVSQVPLGFLETHMSMRRLTDRLVEVFYRRGLRVYPLTASSIAITRRGRIDSLYIESIKLALEMGLTPLLHGDVVFDYEDGFSILSGDQIAVRLALEFEAYKVIFVVDVDGVYDRDPKLGGASLIREISVESIRNIASGGRSSMDVTGGMISKLIEASILAEKGVEVYIVNGLKPGRLYKAIIGLEVEGTRIIGGKTLGYRGKEG